MLPSWSPHTIVSISYALWDRRRDIGLLPEMPPARRGALRRLVATARVCTSAGMAIWKRDVLGGVAAASNAVRSRGGHHLVRAVLEPHWGRRRMPRHHPLRRRPKRLRVLIGGGGMPGF